MRTHFIKDRLHVTRPARVTLGRVLAQAQKEPVNRYLFSHTLDNDPNLKAVRATHMSTWVKSTIRELLAGHKYSIDYYQREYKWERKQVAELIDDLADKFLESHEEGNDRSAVADYGH
jgi:hypothetical protein